MPRQSDCPEQRSNTLWWITVTCGRATSAIFSAAWSPARAARPGGSARPCGPRAGGLAVGPRGPCRARPAGGRLAGRVGRVNIVAAFLAARLTEERRLVDALPYVPSPQSRWLLLSLCAEPRANHLLRTVGHPALGPFCLGHDELMQAAQSSLHELVVHLCPDRPRASRQKATCGS